MKSPPAQVLVLRTGNSTVFLGPPSAWGMADLGPVAVLDKPVEDRNDRLALGVLEALKRDDWQVARLRGYLAGPALAGYGPTTLRGAPQATAEVFYDLRAHLRAHRLRAVAIRNHDRQAVPSAAQRGMAGPVAARGAASAGPQVARPMRPGPVTLPRGGQLPTSRLPSNVAGWSTLDRLMALLHDTLPLLGPQLRAHLEAMTSTEAVAHLLAGMALMAGLQAVPVLGEAADAAFLAMAYAYAGWDGLLAVVHLTVAVRAAVGARSEAEIEAAAPGAADALVTLGGAFLDAVALRMAKRNTSGGGKAGGGKTKGAEQAVDPGRGRKVTQAKREPEDTADRSFFQPKKENQTEPGAVPLTPELEQRMADAQGRAGMSAEGYPDLPVEDAQNFDATPTPWDGDANPGTIYRVVGDSRAANGSYWQLTPLDSEEQWRADSAVQNNWNGDGAYVTSDTGTLRGWQGPAAPQMSSDGVNALPGGGNQIWIPRNTAQPSQPMPTPWSEDQ